MIRPGRAGRFDGRASLRGKFRLERDVKKKRGTFATATPIASARANTAAGEVWPLRGWGTASLGRIEGGIENESHGSPFGCCYRGYGVCIACLRLRSDARHVGEARLHRSGDGKARLSKAAEGSLASSAPVAVSSRLLGERHGCE